MKSILAAVALAAAVVVAAPAGADDDEHRRTEADPFMGDGFAGAWEHRGPFNGPWTHHGGPFTGPWG